MNRKHLDQALALLADAIESQNSGDHLSPSDVIKALPDRSINGNKIDGGKILNFSSSGIVDNSSKTQITVNDESVSINNLRVSNIINDVSVTGTINVKGIVVEEITANKINADIQFDKESSIEFGGDSVENKGLLWKGSGNTKQLIYSNNRIFSSESIDIHKGKHFAINGAKILDEQELGPTVTKSNLRELGRLKGLLVSGDINVNDYFFYNASSDRIGLGTESPKAALTVAEDMIEVSLGTRDETKGFVGTHQNVAFDIVTGDITRISIAGNGNIEIGNVQSKTTIHGSVGINVSNPDNRVDLHVNGAIRFNDKLHLSGTEEPKGGAYNKGDIVWNSEPDVGRPVGWICTKAGAPGIWRTFGIIN